MERFCPCCLDLIILQENRPLVHKADNLWKESNILIFISSARISCPLHFLPQRQTTSSILRYIFGGSRERRSLLSSQNHLCHQCLVGRPVSLTQTCLHDTFGRCRDHSQQGCFFLCFEFLHCGKPADFFPSKTAPGEMLTCLKRSPGDQKQPSSPLLLFP